MMCSLFFLPATAYHAEKRYLNLSGSMKFNLLFINIDKEGKPEAERILKELGVSKYTCLLDIY